MKTLWNFKFTWLLRIYYDHLCCVSLWQSQLDRCFEYERFFSLLTVPAPAEYCQKLCAWLDTVMGHITEPFLLNSLGNV